MSFDEVREAWEEAILHNPSGTIFQLPQKWELTMGALTIKKPVTVRGGPEIRLKVQDGIRLNLKPGDERVKFLECEIIFDGVETEGDRIPALFNVESFSHLELEDCLLKGSHLIQNGDHPDVQERQRARSIHDACILIEETAGVQLKSSVSLKSTRVTWFYSGIYSRAFSSKVCVDSSCFEDIKGTAIDVMNPRNFVFQNSEIYKA